MIADAWNATHSGPPELMGQLFHLFDSPNRFGLPAFYTLHVWAWKENPKGAFVNWHPNVSCESFAGQSPASTVTNSETEKEIKSNEYSTDSRS